MKKIIIFLVIIVIFIPFIKSDKEPNSEVLEETENWLEINKEICKKDLSTETQSEIEKCNALDAYYKFDVCYAFYFTKYSKTVSSFKSMITFFE